MPEFKIKTHSRTKDKLFLELERYHVRVEIDLSKKGMRGLVNKDLLDDLVNGDVILIEGSYEDNPYRLTNPDNVDVIQLKLSNGRYQPLYISQRKIKEILPAV